MVESFFASLKGELIDHGCWKRHSTLGYLSLQKAEETRHAHATAAASAFIAASADRRHGKPVPERLEIRRIPVRELCAGAPFAAHQARVSVHGERVDGHRAQFFSTRSHCRCCQVRTRNPSLCGFHLVRPHQFQPASVWLCRRTRHMPQGKKPENYRLAGHAWLRLRGSEVRPTRS